MGASPAPAGPTPAAPARRAPAAQQAAPLPRTDGASHAGAAPSPDAGALRRALASPGARLEAGRRQRAEYATGTDLGDVRVHTGSWARLATRAVGAAAFTVGRDIVVGTAPGQAPPQRLLDHELVHAAQQQCGRPGRAQEAERQAAEVADRPLLSGSVELVAGGALACAPEDWLTGTPNIGSWGISALLDEQQALTEWLDRQTASTPETDRIREALQAVEAELAHHRTRLQQAERPVRRGRQGRGRGGRGSARAATPTVDLPPESEMPHVLRDRVSTQHTDPAEMRAEVDRITRWLERPDLSRDTRAVLQAELRALAPELGLDLARASGQRRQARLQRALTPTDPQDRASIVANLRLIDSITPYSAQPGTAYVLHEGELLVFPQETADQVRAQAREALATAARRAASMNDGTEYRMSEHLRLNYEDSPVIGFVVSVVSGEEPVELQQRMLGPLADSNIALHRYRDAARGASLAAMGEAVLTALEKAADAQQIVLEGIDRSIAAAGQVVQALEITRDLSFAIALSIGAILAAPVVAAGVAGAGFTGLTATALTAGGTGLVVGGEGFVLGFSGGAGGELVAGHGGRAALGTGLSEGVRVGKQGVAIGIGGGATVGLARNLGLGAEGLSRAGTLWRGALAQGGGGALGSGVGGLLTPPEGMGRGEAGLRGAATGLGLGLLGGTAGSLAEGLSSPVARFALGTGLPSLAGGGVSYLQTGDWHQAVLDTSMGLTLGAAATRAPREPTPMQQRAFSAGQSLASRFGGGPPGSRTPLLPGGLRLEEPEALPAPAPVRPDAEPTAPPVGGAAPPAGEAPTASPSARLVGPDGQPAGPESLPPAAGPEREPGTPGGSPGRAAPRAGEVIEGGPHQVVTVAGERHTLRLLMTETGPQWGLCTNCRPVAALLRRLGTEPGLEPQVVQRLDRMRQIVEALRPDGETNTMRTLLHTLAEAEALVPMRSALADVPELAFTAEAVPRGPGPESADAVAARAAQLEDPIYERLLRDRRETFRGRENREVLRRELRAEARARALTQAQAEIRGAPTALQPGAGPRLTPDPLVDVPMGFHDRPSFEGFARDAYAAIADVAPDASLVLEGSSVTGRRYERVVTGTYEGAPFNVGRVSDYDVAIVSDSLLAAATQRLGLRPTGQPPAIQQLTPAQVRALGLDGFVTRAAASVRSATGVPHEVTIKIYGQGPSDRPRLPLPRTLP